MTPRKVIWKKPQTPAEFEETMTVIEDRGERLLVASSLTENLSGKIRPVTVVRTCDVQTLPKGGAR